jgi:hypothetical protein
MFWRSMRLLSSCSALKVWGDDVFLLGFDAVQTSRQRVSKKHTVSMFRPDDGDTMCLRNVSVYLQVFKAEDWDSMFLQNFGIYVRVYKASKPRRRKIIILIAVRVIYFVWVISVAILRHYISISLKCSNVITRVVLLESDEITTSGVNYNLFFSPSATQQCMRILIYTADTTWKYT